MSSARAKALASPPPNFLPRLAHSTRMDHDYFLEYLDALLTRDASWAGHPDEESVIPIVQASDYPARRASQMAQIGIRGEGGENDIGHTRAIYPGVAG